MFPLQPNLLLGLFYISCLLWISHFGASIGNARVTELAFADDTVIPAESLEVLMMALEALYEDANPVELQVSWAKREVQVFGTY